MGCADDISCKTLLVLLRISAYTSVFVSPLIKGLMKKSRLAIVVLQRLICSVYACDACAPTSFSSINQFKKPVRVAWYSSGALLASAALPPQYSTNAVHADTFDLAVPIVHPKCFASSFASPLNQISLPASLSSMFPKVYMCVAVPILSRL